MKALDETLERATLEIARLLWPKGWRASNVAPTNLSQLVAGFKANGYITVSRLHCDKTVFSCPDVNHAFRAWHDWHHIRLNAEFDRKGEIRVHDAMERDLLRTGYATARARQLLACENIGQLDYWERFGAPPDDQRVFACGYLVARGFL